MACDLAWDAVVVLCVVHMLSGVDFTAVCTAIVSLFFFGFLFACVGINGSDGSPRCLDEGDGGGLHPRIGASGRIL